MIKNSGSSVNLSNWLRLITVKDESRVVKYSFFLRLASTKVHEEKQEAEQTTENPLIESLHHIPINEFIHLMDPLFNAI